MAGAASYSLVSRISGGLHPHGLGLGFVWSWTAALAVAMSAGHIGTSDLSFSVVSLSSQVAVIVLAAVLAPYARGRHLAASRAVALVAGACALVGTVLSAAFLDAAEMPAIQLLAGVLTALGEVLMYLGWADYYASCRSMRLETNVLACGSITLVSAVLFLMVRSPMRWVVCAALVVAETFLALAATGDVREAPKGAASAGEASHARPVSPWQTNLVFALTLFSTYAIIALPEGAISLVPEAGRASVACLAAVAEALLALVIGAVTLYRPLTLDLRWLFRWAAPCLVVGALLLVMGQAQASYLGYFLVTLPDMFAYAALYMHFCAAARRGISNGAFEIGILLAVLNVGSLAGETLGAQATRGGWTFQLVIALVALLMISVALVPSRMAVIAPGKNAGGEGTGTSLSASPLAPDRIARGCERVAVAHELSEREAEVLALLARGRSRTVVGETLGLSANTVASYAKHVYAKLNVHSKQELIDMVDAAGE